MPFDYLHSNVSRSFTQAQEKAEAMYLKELEERAGLLHRLHYDKEVAKNRLRGNIRWDWECNPSPEFVGRLEQAANDIVERVYSRVRPPDKGRRVTAADLKIKPSD